MAMEPWNPWREMMNMRDLMDRMFQDTFVRAGSGLLGRGSVPLDIRETDNGYEVEAALPGVRPEDVQVTVQDDTLTIRGEVKSQEERSDQNWITRERRSGSFYRSVTLPAPVDADRATARFEHGVLRLTLPRSAQAGPKQIRIGAQQSQPTVGQIATSSGQTGVSGTGPTDTEGLAGAGPRTDIGIAGRGPMDTEGVAGSAPANTGGIAGSASTGAGMSGAEASQQQPS